MNDENPEVQKETAIHDLFPHFTEEQLKEAEKQLQSYLEVTIKIYEDLLANPEAYAKFRELIRERKHKKGEVAPEGKFDS